MAKPEWKDAPKWAQWLAQDADGIWRWHYTKPFTVLGQWASGGYSESALITNPYWKETVEERPSK